MFCYLLSIVKMEYSHEMLIYKYSVIPSTHYHISSHIYESKQISSMDTLTLYQPSGANTNQYPAIIIYILVAVGFSYLPRLLYQFITWLLFSHRRPSDERDGESPSPSLVNFLHSLFECKDLELIMLISFNSISRRKYQH